MAATYWRDNSEPEDFSSRGPNTYLFAPTYGTPQAAAPLPAPPVSAKPDLTAADGVHTTFFFGADHRFFGTSAASPHAAAVCALLLQIDPSLTPTALKKLVMDNALLIKYGSPNSTGAGMSNAFYSANALTGQ